MIITNDDDVMIKEIIVPGIFFAAAGNWNSLVLDFFGGPTKVYDDGVFFLVPTSYILSDKGEDSPKNISVNCPSSSLCNK